MFRCEAACKKMTWQLVQTSNVARPAVVEELQRGVCAALVESDSGSALSVLKEVVKGDEGNCAVVPTPHPRRSMWVHH
jgi:hypothetical protein